MTSGKAEVRRQKTEDRSQKSEWSMDGRSHFFWLPASILCVSVSLWLPGARGLDCPGRLGIIGRMLLLTEFPRGKIDPEGVWEASGEAGWVKRLFLRNEAKKSFEINSKMFSAGQN